MRRQLCVVARSLRPVGAHPVVARAPQRLPCHVPAIGRPRCLPQPHVVLAVGGTRGVHLPPHSAFNPVVGGTGDSSDADNDGDAGAEAVADDGQHVGLILGWVGATHRQVARNYAPFFHRRGIPTMVVLPQRNHVLRPQDAVELGREVLRYLSEHSELAERRVVVYGFSVGAYTFSQFLGALAQDEALFDRTRFAGHIWDSPVDWHGVRHGLPRALTESKMMQKVISGMIEAFLTSPAGASAVSEHKVASARFHDVHEHLDAPGLVVYCDKGDHIADAEPCELVTDKWRKGGMDVDTLCFDKSAHVQHLRKHRDTYTDSVDAFLDKVLASEAVPQHEA